MLMARVYRPTGAGPFPTVLDLHGGAWNAKDRNAEEPMDRALAASGVLVVAIDMTLAHRGAVSGLRAGRQLRRALAEVEGAVVERRSVEDRHLRQLERRPRRRTARDAPATIRATTRFRCPRRRSSMRRSPMSAMRSPISDPSRATRTPKKRSAKAWSRTTRPTSSRGRRSTRATPRRFSSARRSQPGADADHAGRARRQRAA